MEGWNDSLGNNSCVVRRIMLACHLSDKQCRRAEPFVRHCTPGIASQCRWPSRPGPGEFCTVASEFGISEVEFLRHNVYGGLYLQAFKFFSGLTVFSYRRLPTFDGRLVRGRLRTVSFAPGLELQDGRYTSHLEQCTR